MKKLLLITLICIFFIACKKETVADSYYQMPQEAKDYLQSFKGTYLFKDSASGNIDTVVVGNSEIVKMHYVSNAPSSGILSGNVSYYYDRYYLVLNKTNNFKNEEWLRARSNISSMISGEDEIMDTTNQYNSFKIFDCKYYPTKDPNSYSEIQNNINFEDNKYNSVLKCYSENYLFNGSVITCKKIYYWVKGIGIVKRTISIGGLETTATLLKHY